MLWTNLLLLVHVLDCTTLHGGSGEIDTYSFIPTEVQMATNQVMPPEPFDFSRPEEWPRWLRRFQRFSIASDLATRDEVKQVNTLIYCMGDRADDILWSFQLSAADEKKI